MSLKVWLPLLGSLENKGTSNSVVTNSGATVNTAGKIGSCYSFDGSDDFISITDTSLYSIFKGGAQPFSIAMWVYHADSTRAILFGDYNLSGSISFNIELTTGHVVRFYWNANPDYSTTINVGASTWAHVVITYDGSSLRSYLNGSLINTRAGTIATLNKTSGAFYLGRDSRTGTTALNGRLNDVRIYDHCLSPTEVKEIARGLVRHYKLENKTGNNIIPGTDDWSTWYKGSRWSIDGNVLTYSAGSVSWVDADSPCVPWADVENTPITVSIEARSDDFNYTSGSGFSYCIVRKSSGPTAASYSNRRREATPIHLTSNTVGTEWKRYTYTYPNLTDASFTNTYNGGGGDWFGIYLWNYTNKSIQVRNIKIEYGLSASPWTPSASDNMSIALNGNDGIVEDSSGYDNHATIVGTASYVSSPRYSNGTYMNCASSTNHIEAPALPSTVQTISFWSKNLGGTSHVEFVDPSCGLMFAPVGSSAAVRTATANQTMYAISSPYYVNGQWNHIVVQKDGTTYKLWTNGTSRGSSGSNYYRHDGSLMYLFNRNYNSSYGANACMSDFRAYVTLLSEADILELYNVNASVLKENNMRTYEFCESSDITIAPTGIVTTGGICEFNKLSTLKYDTNIYIEPDGSSWVRIFHHNNASSKLFASSNTFETSCYIDEDRWFNMEVCYNVTQWEFMIKSKTTVSAIENKYRWIQSVNPMTAVYADVAVANVTKISNGYNTIPASWGGIFKKNSNTYLCANNGTSSNWWGAIGAWALSSSAVPGWTSGITTGYEDVYLRVDNLQQASVSSVQFKKSGMINAANFIET